MKVQRICWCLNCEEMLPKHCSKCIIHPDRKPRVVELYGVPPVISTNACGCVLLRCQRDTCLKTMWRHPRADGTLGHKNHFCSPECVRIITAAAKVDKRVTVVCSDGCGRLVTRPASNMRAKHAYFSPLCHYRHRIQMKSDARRVGPREVQTFACASKDCRGAVVDHQRLPTGLYECVRCRARAKEPAMLGYV